MKKTSLRDLLYSSPHCSKTIHPILLHLHIFNAMKIVKPVFKNKTKTLGHSDLTSKTELTDDGKGPMVSFVKWSV